MFFNKLKPSSIRESWANSKVRFHEWQQHWRENFPKSFDDLKQLQANELLKDKNPSTLFFGFALFLAAYFLADTVALVVDSFIPEAPIVVPPPVVRKEEKQKRSLEEFQSIISRNIFNSKGLIPEDGLIAKDAPARKTSLPLNLIGTVVLKNELKSIAAIEDKAQNMVFPVRIDDTINNQIQITKIEHLRVYFINQSTGHLEYVEIIEDTPILNTQPAKGSKKTNAKDGIASIGENQFEIERNTIDNAVAKLSDVLQQARAVPNFENGLPDGYKILQIESGSIYEKLGIKNNDIVTALNGESINDPGKAFQIFNELKSMNHVEISIKRNGRPMKFSYDIR